jgi:hypothetical protein
MNYWYVFLAIGVLAGGFGYHYLLSPLKSQIASLHAKFDSLHAKFDSVIAALKK